MIRHVQIQLFVSAAATSWVMLAAIRWQTTTLDIRQRLAFEIFQYEVIGAVPMPDVVQRTDVRMIQGGNRARLTVETLTQSGVIADVRR